MPGPESWVALTYGASSTLCMVSTAHVLSIGITAVLIILRGKAATLVIGCVLSKLTPSKLNPSGEGCMLRDLRSSHILRNHHLCKESQQVHEAVMDPQWHSNFGDIVEGFGGPLQRLVHFRACCNEIQDTRQACKCC